MRWPAEQQRRCVRWSSTDTAETSALGREQPTHTSHAGGRAGECLRRCAACVSVYMACCAHEENHTKYLGAVLPFFFTPAAITRLAGAIARVAALTRRGAPTRQCVR